MHKKYAIFPGLVASKTDGQMHHVDARTLMTLYRVNAVECVVIMPDVRPSIARIESQGLIALRPRFDGNYTLPDADGVME